MSRSKKTGTGASLGEYKSSLDGFSKELEEQIKPLYLLPNDNLSEDALVPCFKLAQSVSCMVGFFSSAVLASLAPGLATFINRSQQSLRLIVSPFIGEADQKAMEEGLRSTEDIAEQILAPLLITEDALQQHTLRCLSYLLRIKRLEMKIAVMPNALFHPKVWLFTRDTETVAVHGSSNMTQAGIKHNFEQISVSKSWVDPTQKYIIDKLQYQFDRLWSDNEDACKVISLPKALQDRLLRSYPSGTPPTEEEFRKLYAKAQSVYEVEVREPDPVQYGRPVFSIPKWLKYEEGDYEHQGLAVNAWCNAGHRGTLEMATGSGKTLTSMVCAYRLHEMNQPLIVVVAAPYRPLIEQWCGEIELFGVKPTNLTTIGNASARTRTLQQINRRLRLGISKIEIVVTSHDTLCSHEFSTSIAAFDCSKLLIADEAHNLGRQSFISNPPEHYNYRLALSATPVRQYDPEGTDAIFDYFGPVVFSFTLKEAIGRCLVEYEYFVHPVELTTTELDDWYELTNKIKKSAWRQKDGMPDDYLTKLFRDRRLLLETASGKMKALQRLLEKEDLKNLVHTLIYCSDKSPEQLETVNELLREKNIIFHQLTSEETANREATQKIIGSFQEGSTQVLTAKRVLDEGVNIPQIRKAFILASTTVERQWVQRRGRLLRICKEIGKTHSVIHDFLALPPIIDDALDDDARSLIRSELTRAQEFASLARNAGRPDGPLPIIAKLVKAAYL